MPTSDTAIVVHRLGKQYRIGAPRDTFPTLRDSIARAAVKPFRRLRAVARGRRAEPPANSIWALRDVSFEVRRGDVVGIVGRNGAGKSTLLKILSRITEPTDGWARISGRLGSMLEVGTGFHPELTGRENLYLNGSIMGMKRAEIDRKFDEIVEFSGVAPLLDTPVKHYASGMYVRLAFAVAAHLEPDILLVDEVLAVGDAGFQRKCLAKMKEISREGRTVIFVSHNMGLVRSLCRRAVLLRDGSVEVDDTAAKVVAAYLRSLEEAASASLLERVDRRGRGRSRLARIEIDGGDKPGTGTLLTGLPARFAFRVTRAIPHMSCSFTIYDQYGQPVTYFDSAETSAEDVRDPSRGQVFSCEIGELILNPGRYRINAALVADGELQDHLEGAGHFQVEQGAVRGRPGPRGTSYGCVSLPHRWSAPS